MRIIVRETKTTRRLQKGAIHDETAICLPDVRSKDIGRSDQRTRILVLRPVRDSVQCPRRHLPPVSRWRPHPRPPRRIRELKPWGLGLDSELSTVEVQYGPHSTNLVARMIFYHGEQEVVQLVPSPVLEKIQAKQGCDNGSG